MKEKDIWTKKVRDRMEGYSEPVPAGLWEELEKELAAPKVIPMWRRWQVVAAVGVLVILSSVTVWLWQSPSLDYIEQQSAELHRLKPVVEPSLVPHVPATSGQTVAQLAPTVTPATGKKQVGMRAQSVTEEPLWVDAVEPEETCEERIEAPETKSTKQETTADTKQPQPTSRSVSSTSSYNKVYASTRRQQDRRWSVGLSTTNGTFSSSAQMDGYLALPRAAKGALMSDAGYRVQARGDLDKVIQFANLAEGETGKSDVKYRMPVTVGLSFRFDLTDKWALETGLTYTQLSSETRSGAKQNNYGWEDKLHYVGIPLKLNRELWSNRRFEVYASAGGAAEKCVSGKQTLMWNTTANVMNGSTEPAETDIKVKALQWSLTAAAGAQWKVTDRLGIYVEPGVVYYFDDGSEVNTIRKEHPFNFNLQLGVRLTVSK